MRGPGVVFVGNLPPDVREREVDDLFYKYGRIKFIDLKTPLRPPAFAFVEYEDPRDAEDAVRGRDGYDFFGSRLRVELARGGGGGGPPPFGGGFGGGWGPPPPFGGGYGMPSRMGPGAGMPPTGSAHRCIVKGLPISASWQDLKDHFRKSRKPSYVNVFHDRGGVIGVVEFDTREDLKTAIADLDDTEFKNPFNKCYIRVRDDSRRSRSRGRSYSRSRSRSPRGRRRSYSRSRSPYSRSRSLVSRSRSPVSKSRSRSPMSKSRSRSPVSKSRSRSPVSKSRSPSPAKSASRSKSRSRSP